MLRAPTAVSTVRRLQDPLRVGDFIGNWISCTAHIMPIAGSRHHFRDDCTEPVRLPFDEATDPAPVDRPGDVGCG